MSTFPDIDTGETTADERQEIAAAWLLTYGRAEAIRLAKQLRGMIGGDLADKRTYGAVARILEDTPEGK